jgi:tRNA threonylcarbamoyladenosine biosynthesis protein TsaB
MSLLLAIETSGARYGLALGEGGAVRFETAEGAEGERDLAALLRRGLKAIGAAVSDVGAIAVDVGPGSLGSLRDGVSFANGLAYARALPVFAFQSFELIGAVAHRATGLPVLCVRRANEGLVYAGLHDGARVVHMRHGARDDVVPAVAAGETLALAGSFRDIALPGVRIVDSGVEAPLARTMIELGIAGRAAHDALRAPALPLTESASVFRA